MGFKNHLIYNWGGHIVLYNILLCMGCYQEYWELKKSKHSGFASKHSKTYTHGLLPEDTKPGKNTWMFSWFGQINLPSSLAQQNQATDLTRSYPQSWEFWYWDGWFCSLDMSWPIQKLDIQRYWDTLWLFNIAMENCPFIDGLPIKNGEIPWLC